MSSLLGGNCKGIALNLILHLGLASGVLKEDRHSRPRKISRPGVHLGSIVVEIHTKFAVEHYTLRSSVLVGCLI